MGYCGVLSDGLFGCKRANSEREKGPHDDLPAQGVFMKAAGTAIRHFSNSTLKRTKRLSDGRGQK